MFVITENEDMINLNHFEKVSIVKNSILVAIKGNSYTTIAEFDDSDTANKARDVLFASMERGDTTWNVNKHKNSQPFIPIEGRVINRNTES